MKKILFLFLIFSSICLASINDSLGLFSQTEIKAISEKIEEIKSSKNVTSYVNTMQIGEGFKVSDPERTIILNLKKDDGNTNVDIELSFSKDMEIDDKTEDINKLLEMAEPIIKEKQYYKYVMTILDGISQTVEKVDVVSDKPYQMTKASDREDRARMRQIIFLAILVIVLIALVEILKSKKKKKKKKQSLIRKKHKESVILKNIDEEDEIK